MKKNVFLAYSTWAAALLVSGCQYTRDATFVISGHVSNTTGTPVVLGVDHGTDLCADVTYNELAQGRVVTARTVTVCQDLITDQAGNYALTLAESLPMSGKKSDGVDIKNFRVYGRRSFRSQSSTTYYILPAKITDLKISKNGAAIRADVTVMDY